jgi:hypothetical protein
MGPDHVDTITNLNTLALVYQAEAKYTDAEPLLTGDRVVAAVTW